MAGGLMQLVAYGAQDVYLTGDPKVTFFQVVYRRHTNFAMEAIRMNLQGSIGNGNTVQVVIPRDGDVIGDVWAEFTPTLSATPVWIAERAFKTVELTIGGQRIDKHYQLWFRLWSEVFQSETQKLAYGKLSSLGNSSADSSAPNTVSLPLLFFFNKNPGLFLPLIALQYHEVRIIFELADDYLNYFSSSYFNLWGNYMFLDKEERRIFATKGHEYLIEQVQHNGGDVVASGNFKPSFRLPYQHPVKELIWCFQNPSVTGTNMWNFCVDTSNVYTTTAQISNTVPHWFGSPIISVPSPAQGAFDSGTTFTFTNKGLFGNAASISSDGTAFVIGAPNSASAVSATATAGSAKVYRYTSGKWDTGNFLNPATEPATSSLYGSSVAISPDGTQAVVGSPGTTNGTIYAFKYINGTWSAWTSQAGSGTEKLGTSVAITNGGQVAVGGPAKTTNTGEVLVYNVNNVGGFTAVGSAITSAAAATSDYFGTSVALDTTGTILAVGAPMTSASTGYANVFRFSSVGTWVADASFTFAGTASSRFGTSVSLNSAGTILAVGAPGVTTTSGVVKVFSNIAGTGWSLTSTISSTGTDRFGTSVSLNPAGTLLAAGSPSGGYVRVYQSSAGAWPAYSGNTYGYTDATSNINFGQSVSISQNLVIGASANTAATSQVNYANVYAPTLTPYKTWVEEGGETAAVTTGPLSSLNIDLNGQSRFFPQNGKYFNQYQPYRYHSGSPYPGIYCYSFALKPELHQPSGTCNFSRVDNSQINMILKNSMYTPCNFKLFAVNYNILRIQAGMSGLAFSN